MFTKSLLAIVFTVAMAALTIASDSSDAVKVGDNIILRLTGKLAAEFSKKTGTLKAGDKAPDGLHVEFSALVCQQLDGNRFRIEGQLPFTNQNKQLQMITLSAVVDTNQIKQYEIPKGTETYSMPSTKQFETVRLDSPEFVAALKKQEPVKLTKPSRGERLELSDLKQVKLRVWTLADETGG